MGNYKFRLSDMIPNAWFYKLKDMSKTRKSKSPNTLKKKHSPSTTISQNSNLPQPKYSYYFTTNPIIPEKLHNFSPLYQKSSGTNHPDPPRRSSSKKKAKRKTIYKPSPKPASIAVDSRCHDNTHDPLQVESSDYFLSSTESSPGQPNSLHKSVISESESDTFAVPDPFKGIATWSSPCHCRVTSSTTDIIIDMNNAFYTSKAGKLDEDDTISMLELPPIITKQGNFKNDLSTMPGRNSSKWNESKSRKSFSVKIVKEERIRKSKELKTNPVARKSSANSAGIRLRSNSPKIASKKLQACARKSVSSNTVLKLNNKNFAESFAVVTSSNDPQRDFRNSMMEMIAENDIRAPKDLEDLLACYLSLNSNEYHHLIIKAFEQMWFDITEPYL